MATDNKNHQLKWHGKQSLIGSHKNYAYGFKCNRCQQSYKGGSYHCPTCLYDLCSDCNHIEAASKNNHFGDEKVDGASVCDKGHPMLYTNAKGLTKSHPGYKNGFKCNRCSQTIRGVGSYHCKPCLADLCEDCNVVMAKDAAMNKGGAKAKGGGGGGDAATDSLTGLPLKQLFDAKLQGHCKQNAMKLTVLSIDVDNLKQLNNQSHAAANRVIKGIADILKECCDGGPGLSCYRPHAGGDEFLVVIEDRTLDQAHSIAEVLRVEVDDSTKTTISVGLAYKKDKEIVNSIFQRAEVALNDCKKTKNKNCITVSK